MVTFTCEVKDCQNNGVDYPMDTEYNYAECGTCGTLIEGVRNE